MPSTAAVTLSIVLSGAPEGTDLYSLTLTNSTAVGTVSQAVIATSGVANASTFSVPTNARACLIVGPGGAGSSGILRLAPSTGVSSANAMALASSGFAFLPVCSTAGPSTAILSTVVLWTTGTVSTSNPTRVSFF